MKRFNVLAALLVVVPPCEWRSLGEEIVEEPFELPEGRHGRLFRLGANQDDCLGDIQALRDRLMKLTVEANGLGQTVTGLFESLSSALVPSSSSNIASIDVDISPDIFNYITNGNSFVNIDDNDDTKDNLNSNDLDDHDSVKGDIFIYEDTA